MADSYVDYNYVGPNEGTLEEPYTTTDAGLSGASNGETIFYKDGVHQHATEDHDLSGTRNIAGVNFRRATLKPAAGASQSVRIRTLDPAFNPHIVDRLIIDADGATQALILDRDSSGDGAQRIESIRNTEFIQGSAYALRCVLETGRLELINCKFRGTASNQTISASSNIGRDGAFTLDVNRVEFRPDPITVTGRLLINFKQQDNGSANDVNLFFKGLDAMVECEGSGSATIIQCATSNSLNVATFTIDFSSTTAENCVAIEVSGLATAGATSDANITNGVVNFRCPVGYGVSYGFADDADSHIADGTVSGVTVYGAFYESDTPHNFAFRRGTNGSFRGNYSIGGYVGYLFSRVDNATFSGNTAIDCYGPNVFVKGATDCTIKDNVLAISGKYTQRDNGVMAVTDQGGVDTASATIQENLVIVADVSKIHSLAQITDSDQTCTFVRNTYIIPDSVDLSTAQLFAYQSSTANNTFAQWLAQTEVTDDVVIQMPGDQISSFINRINIDFYEVARVQRNTRIINKETNEEIANIVGGRIIKS